LGSTFRDLAIQRECRVIEGHFLPDQYTHADFDTPEVFSLSGYRLSEREKCHSDSQNVHGAEKEFYRSTFLG
jgi:hypothetical protein